MQSIPAAGTDSGDFRSQFQEMGASRDVEPAIIRVAKRHVRRTDAGLRFAVGLRQMQPAQRLSFRRCDLDAAGSPSAGGVKVPPGVDAHSIGAVVHEDFAVCHGIVRLDLVSHRPASPGSDIQILLIRRQRNAVRCGSGRVLVATQQRHLSILDQKVHDWGPGRHHAFPTRCR